MDILTVSVFLGTLAILFAGYALFRSYSAAWDRAQMRDLYNSTRPRGGIGRAIGGSNTVGED